MIKKGRQVRELDFQRIIPKVFYIYQVWPNRKHWFLFFHGVIRLFLIILKILSEIGVEYN